MCFRISAASLVPTYYMPAVPLWLWQPKMSSDTPKGTLGQDCLQLGTITLYYYLTFKISFSFSALTCLTHCYMHQVLHKFLLNKSMHTLQMLKVQVGNSAQCCVAACMGGGVWGRRDTFMCIAESLPYSLETTTTLLIGYISIHNKKFKVWEKNKKGKIINGLNRSQFLQSWLGCCLSNVHEWLRREMIRDVGNSTLFSTTIWSTESLGYRLHK